MRSAIRDLPDGTYIADDFVDGDGLEPGQKRIVVTLTIAGDTLSVDFTGTHRKPRVRSTPLWRRRNRPSTTLL